MIFLFLMPLYFAANIFIFYRLWIWIKYVFNISKNKITTVSIQAIGLFCTLSPILAFLLPKNKITVKIRIFSTFWTGLILYYFSAIVILELIRFAMIHTTYRKNIFFSRKGIVISGLVVIITAGITCVYGFAHAKNIKISSYNVKIDKQVENMNELNAVLIADTHMGYAIGKNHISKMVDKINSCEPDIVIFAGDIFDNGIDGIDYPDDVAELFKSIKSKYGIWATYGNHDINEKILMGFTFNWGKSPENDTVMTEFLKKADINLLSDETKLIDDKFYLVGRRDGEKPGTENGQRLSPEELVKDIDMSKPVFFIDHEPADLQSIADVGADIDFSGHTHDGQVFPGTVLTDLMWENSCGMIKKDSMYSIVTSGVGIYGPFMRVGSDAEICNVHITFNN